MTETNRSQQCRLSGRMRIAAAIIAVGLSCPLVVAVVLRPDRSGHGTHRQLGLPPCTFVVLFGRRCPTCGMTTAWAHMVRGEVVGAFRANVGGTLLAILSMLAVPWLLFSAIAGRCPGGCPTASAVIWILAAVAVVTLIDWGVRMLLG